MLGRVAGKPSPPLPNRALLAFEASKKAVDDLNTKASVNYITIKTGSYVATNCTALSELGALFTKNHANPTSKALKFTIQVPCKAGFVKVGPNTINWDTPNYNCFDAAANKSIQAVFLTDNRAGSLILTAMTKGGGCVLPGGKLPAELPYLYGGAPADEYGLSEANILTVGSNNSLNYQNPALKTINLMTTTITGVSFNGSFLRPAIGAYNGKSLVLKYVNVINGLVHYGGAALDAVDTTVSISGHPKSYALWRNNSAIGYEDNPGISTFPGAGGAINIRQDLQLAPFNAKFVSFLGNTHTAYGGVYYLWKLNPKATRAFFTFCDFQANRAGKSAGGDGGCAVGVTYREDGYYTNDIKQLLGVLPLYGLPLFVSLLSKVTFNLNSGNSGPLSSAILCGLYAKNIPWEDGNFTTMPWSDPLRTKVLTSLTSVPTAPLSPLNNSIIEYVFVTN